MGVVVCYNESNSKKNILDGGIILEGEIINDEKTFKKYIEDEEKQYEYDQEILNVVGANPSVTHHIEFNGRGKADTVVDIWWEDVKDDKR